MDAELGWLAALIDLDDSGVLPCSISETNKMLLLTRRGAAASTQHKDLFVEEGESSGFFFIATGEVSLYLYLALGSTSMYSTVLHGRSC